MADRDDEGEGAGGARQLLRLRWSVPRADASVVKWLEAQYNVSQSLRILIRESIQREGYVDLACRPVEQLPRRGRPPGTGEDPSSAARARDDRPGPDGEEPDEGAAQAPQAPEGADDAGVGEDDPHGQFSIDQIMASTRR